MKLRLALLAVSSLCLIATPLVAQVDLYDDGPTDGTTDAWTINFGFTLSDSFTLSNPGSVSGLQFAAWLLPGDVLESVEVSMTSDEFGGTIYFQQQVDITQSGCVLNQYNYNVCTETAIFSGPSLNAGFYWLNLQNGVVNTGDPVYWDEDRGPSEASENSLGTVPSESFTILGSTGTSTTTGTTPEPGSLMLFGSGVLGFLGIVRRKFGR
jgi:PEP-CTERM motif-containing protein